MSRLNSVGEINWRKGTLRPYESAISVGAKYCFLNKVKPIEFSRLLNDLIEVNNSSDFVFTFDNPNLSPEKISKVFGEPIGMTKQLSLLSVFELENLNKISYFSESVRNLRYCKKCLNEGYHSTLHQLPWLTKCFIHTTHLENLTTISKSLPILQKDLRILKDLFNVWFVNQDFWPSCKSESWELINTKIVASKANKLLTELYTIENQLNIIGPIIIIGKNPYSNINVSINSMPLRHSSLNKLNSAGHLSFIDQINFKCSTEESELIRQLTPGKVLSLMQARQIYCDVKEINPKWKVILKNLKSNLFEDHSECLTFYKKSFTELETIRVKYYPLVLPPYNMNRFDMVPCKRISTLKLAESLFEYETKSLVCNNWVDELKRILNDYGNGHNLLNDCINQNLIIEWEGKITRNQHEFLKSYEAGYILGENITNMIKQVNIYVPSGNLIPIIDELLLAYVHSWIMALYDVETQSERLKGERSYNDEIFNTKIIKLSPSILIAKALNGIQLFIGSKVKNIIPNFKLEIDKKNHHNVVRAKSKQLSKIFDYSLAKSLQDYDQDLRFNSERLSLIRRGLISR